MGILIQFLDDSFARNLIPLKENLSSMFKIPLLKHLNTKTLGNFFLSLYILLIVLGLIPDYFIDDIALEMKLLPVFIYLVSSTIFLAVLFSILDIIKVKSQKQINNELPNEIAVKNYLKWHSWNPFQSRISKQICAHLTPAEKAEYEKQGMLYGLWCAATFAIPLSNAFQFTSLYIIIFSVILIAIHLICIPIWMKKQRELLSSTKWANSQGFKPDDLKRIGKKNCIHF